jgi:hypothetical protein
MEKTFVYIDEFIYSDPITESDFYGHPKPGKVYLVFKNGKKYRIPLKSMSGIGGVALEGDQFQADDGGKWSYKLTEINEYNLADLDLSIKDLETIEQGWVHGKFEEDVPKKPKSSLIMEELESLLSQEGFEKEKIEIEEMGDKDIEARFNEINEYLNAIVDADPHLFQTVYEILGELVLSLGEQNYSLKQSILSDINKLTEIRKKSE